MSTPSFSCAIITIMTTRLASELALLYRVEAVYKIPAAPVVRQLVEWEEQSLPDVLPRCPRWVEFEWPESGSVNLEAWWRAKDRERGARWMGAYL